MGGSPFWPPPLYYFTLSFILSHVCCPSSTCRVNLSKTDICPVSLIPESLGVVDKAEESGSVGYRVLSGKSSKGSFPEIFWIFFQVCSCTLFLPLFSMKLWVCRGLNCPRLHLRAILCLIFLSLGHNLFRLRPLDSP